MLPLSPQNPDVRAEEFISRAGQEIAVPILHVDEPVRRVMHGIEINQRPRFVGQVRDAANLIDGADDVGSTGNGDQPDARCEMAAQVVQIESAIFGMNVHEATVAPASAPPTPTG